MKRILLLSALATVLLTARAAEAIDPGSQIRAQRSLTFGGITRSYVVRAPVSQAKDAKRVPLVLVLHGGGGNAASAEQMTGFTEKARKEGFIVVYPDGTGRLATALLTWNAGHCCGHAMNQNIDDVGFIRALIDELVRTYPVDPSRIYATGMSNGGMMTHRLGIELSNRLAAIAPVVATVFGDEKKPARPVSALMVNGMLDKNVPHAGGTPGGRGANAWDGSPARPTLAQGEFWASANGCKRPPLEDDDDRRTRWRYACPSGLAVELLLVKDNGHAWPGGQPGSRRGDKPSSSLNATDMIWEFFEVHGKSVAAQADPSALEQKVDAVIDQAIAQDRIVGAVVLVAQDGRLVYERAAGLADKESRKPMQVDTLFRFSSVTKPIVTVAALALVERKKLSLDDPVTKWLPDFKPKLADGTTPTITVRQLLTHTAGLGYKFGEKPGGPYHKAQISDGFDDVKIDLAEEMRRLASEPLLDAPGSQWRYGLSIDVLGAVMERATRQPLATVVADLVTKPLGMKDTSFWIDRAQADRLATPYFNAPSGTARMADPQDLPSEWGTLVYSPSRAFDSKAFPSGGAGMIGSSPDVLRLLEALRKGGAPVLEKSTVDAMFRDQVPGLPGQLPGASFGFGGGLVIDPAAMKTPQSVGTMYWGGVYGHSWFVDPTRKVTVVALTNTALEGMSGKFTVELCAAVYEGIQR